jgi:hypothetical protein
MESSHPMQLSNVFSEDYEYFESNHVHYPTDAAAVFGCVADLRVALQAFRDAAQRSKQQVDVGIKRTESVLGEHPTDVTELLSSEHASDVAAPALLASVDGSIEVNDAATSL